MLIYLALSEHTAPLGGIPDVFIKDAISEYMSSCKGRIRHGFHFFLVHRQKLIFFLDTFWNGMRYMGRKTARWHRVGAGIRKELWCSGEVGKTLTMEPEATIS